MQKGNIGVTTENIFPVIKKSCIVIMKFFSVSWFLTRLMLHRS